MLIKSFIHKALEKEADMVVFPELCLCGYPPEDLVMRPAFIKENLKYLNKLTSETKKILVIVGFINKENDLYNSAAVIYKEKIVAAYNKQYLPNYSVFDEERYFQKGQADYVFRFKDNLFSINICEDIYYPQGPVKKAALLGGAELIINISASPYHIGKIEEREKMLYARATDNRVNILYANMVGGQDELVFDGSSLVLDCYGKTIARAESFKEELLVFDVKNEELSSARLKDAKYRNQRLLMASNEKSPVFLDLDSFEKNKTAKTKRSLNTICNKKYSDYICCEEEEILMALSLATKDYIIKNGFKKTVLGLSGGIDSALVAAIASMAIGSENVTGVIMPSLYSSSDSVIDSRKLAQRLKINVCEIPINKIYDSYLETLKSTLKSDEINLTKENIQARIRGNILMALSNEYGWLLLSTGNKSEVSVGYCTLYGDMAGGFAPIKDIYKTALYKICAFINKKNNNMIPQNIIDKPPSAELRPDQKDEDSLPPYEILDPIIKAYIEDDMDYKAIVGMGYKKNIVLKVLSLIDFSEYKRRQAAPGVKITQRAFGKDRRYPITNKFKLG